MKIDADKKYLVEVAKRLEEDINIVENKNYLLNKEKQQVNKIFESLKEEKEINIDYDLIGRCYLPTVEAWRQFGTWNQCHTYTNFSIE